VVAHRNAVEPMTPDPGTTCHRQAWQGDRPRPQRGM